MTKLSCRYSIPHLHQLMNGNIRFATAYVLASSMRPGTFDAIGELRGVFDRTGARLQSDACPLDLARPNH